MVRRHRSGWSIASIARAQGVTPKTVRKWIERFEEEGPRGLFDRSSRPLEQPCRTSEELEAKVLELRRKRLTGRQIAAELGMPRSTVGVVLRRNGLGRLHLLEPPEPVRRYEKASPGELLHIDIKKLGRFWRPGHRTTGRQAGYRRCRGAGWDFIHVAIDDYSRVAYVEVLDDEKGETAAGFIERAVAWFASRGVTIRAVLSDNGACYRSRAFRKVCDFQGLRRKRTRPYRPQTNGKAERFIKTLLTEWAYAVEYGSSRDRVRALPAWLAHYNGHRPHAALGYSPPLSRLDSRDRDNVLRNHI